MRYKIPEGNGGSPQRASWPHRAAIKESVLRLEQRGCVLFVDRELLQDFERAPLAIHHPCDAAGTRNATSVQPAKPRAAVKITVVADYHRAQRFGSVFLVPVRIQRAERMQHGELARSGDFDTSDAGTSVGSVH